MIVLVLDKSRKLALPDSLIGPSVDYWLVSPPATLLKARLGVVEITYSDMQMAYLIQ